MTNHDISAEYLAMLRAAMCRPEVRAFALNRLELSLDTIGIDPGCRSHILQLLMVLIRDRAIKASELSEQISAFEMRWKTHLDRAYFHDYETTRWDEFRRLVFSNLPASLGRCLDVGCGRGCVSASLLQNGLATQVVGIDETDFCGEWHERRSSVRTNLSFHHVAVEDLGGWVRSNGKFDTVLMFYVLHHSNDYWVAKTLDSLASAVKSDGIIAIVEDSFVEGTPPVEDRDNIYKRWAEWTSSVPNYRLSAGFDVQIILDFVAVQLLARFREVQMPCNYKTGQDWADLFVSLGYKVESTVNIGFPAYRDIDVPQALFVLKHNGSMTHDAT